MPEKTTLKIFIASSAELKAERERCIQIIVQINKSHSHLHLCPVEWEIDMVHSNYPDYKNIQNAINLKLKETQLAIFIFYSKIGKYTREEFEFVSANKIRLFAYFKKGFSPKKEQIKAYEELLDFKESLNEKVLYEEYDEIVDFEKQLFPNLNLYLVENFSNTIHQSNTPALSQSNQLLVKMLYEKEQEIKRLKETRRDKAQKIIKLTKGIEAIRNQLQQSQEIVQQQAKDKEDVEKLLSPQKENNKLKAKALEAVERGNYNEAEEYLKESAKNNIAETSSTFYVFGKIKKIQLLYFEAYEYFALAVKIAPQNTSYLFEAGSIAEDLGYFNKAIEYFEKLLAIEIQRNGEEHIAIAIVYNKMGGDYINKGQYDKAIEYYEKALVINKKHYGEGHLKIGAYYNNFGSIYHLRGKYDRAIEYYEMALAIEGHQAWTLATLNNNLGETYRKKGEYDTAIEYFEKALAIGIKFFGEEHPQIAMYYNNLGLTYCSRCEYEKAIKYHEKALIMYKKSFGEEHPHIALNYNNLGSAYHSQGNYDKALEYYKKALNIDRKFRADDPSIATLYNNIGTAYLGKGEFEKAIRYYERSLAILNKFLHPTHPNIRSCERNLELARSSQQK